MACEILSGWVPKLSHSNWLKFRGEDHQQYATEHQPLVSDFASAITTNYHTHASCNHFVLPASYSSITLTGQFMKLSHYIRSSWRCRYNHSHSLRHNQQADQRDQRLNRPNRILLPRTFTTNEAIASELYLQKMRKKNNRLQR
jgi:hypothetical protein